MQATFRSAELAMHRGQSLELGGARHSLITGVRGAVWLTHEGDQNDRVIEPGQSFEVADGGQVWLFALDESQVKVEQIPVVRRSLAQRMGRGIEAGYMHVLRGARRHFETQRETSLAY